MTDRIPTFVNTVSGRVAQVPATDQLVAPDGSGYFAVARQVITYHGIFSGKAKATVSGREFIFTAPFDCTIIAAQVNYGDAATATGDTTLTANGLDFTILQADYQGARTTGSVAVAAGDPITVSVTTGGLHQNVQFTIEVRRT